MEPDSANPALIRKVVTETGRIALVRALTLRGPSAKRRAQELCSHGTNLEMPWWCQLFVE